MITENTHNLLDSCQDKSSMSLLQAEPPQSNRGLLSPITTTQADMCPLGMRKGQGYELTIDWISATATKKMRPIEFNELLRTFSKIPGNKLKLTGTGFGSGYARYSTCYRSVNGGVFAYTVANYRTVRTVDIKDVQLGEFFDSVPVEIRWKSSRCPTIKNSGIPALGLIRSKVIKLHNHWNHYSIIVPSDWLGGADDYELEVIQSKLGFDFNLQEGTVPQYLFSSNCVRWRYYDNEIHIIDDGDINIDAAINEYRLKVEFPGEFLRKLTLVRCLDILKILEDTGFRLTRIDPRLRDWSRVFEPAELFDYAINGHISQVNVFSAPRIDYQMQLDGSILMKSPTFYAGSSQSEKRSRVYCEREKHGCDSVAYETVLKDNKAREFMTNLLSLYHCDSSLQSVRKRILDAVFSVYAITQESRGTVEELIQKHGKLEATAKIITKNKSYDATVYHPRWQRFIDTVYSYFLKQDLSDIKPVKINGYRGGAKTSQLWKTPVEAQKRAMNFHLRVAKSRYMLMQSMSPHQWEYFVKTEQNIGQYAVKKQCDHEYASAVISRSREHTKDYMTLRFLEDCYHRNYSLEKMQDNLLKIESDFDSANYRHVGVSTISTDIKDSKDFEFDVRIDMSTYFDVIENTDDYFAIKDYLEDVRSGQIMPFST